MDSSPSPLTPLQLALLRGLAGDEDLFLTGGSALGHFYLHHRRSLDLDFFVMDAPGVDRVAGRLGQVAATEGWTIATVRHVPGFRRFSVTRGTESTIIDVVHETAHQVVPKDRKPIREGIRVDDLDDLVPNKLCAILGRGDVKDLVDLYFLAESGIDILAHLPSAGLKDGGMEPTTLAWVLRSMTADPASLDLLKPLAPATLQAFRDDLVRRLATLAWPA